MMDEVAFLIDLGSGEAEPARKFLWRGPSRRASVPGSQRVQTRHRKPVQLRLERPVAASRRGVHRPGHALSGHSQPTARVMKRPTEAAKTAAPTATRPNFTRGVMNCVEMPSTKSATVRITLTIV